MATVEARTVRNSPDNPPHHAGSARSAIKGHTAQALSCKGRKAAIPDGAPLDPGIRPRPNHPQKSLEKSCQGAPAPWTPTRGKETKIQDSIQRPGDAETVAAAAVPVEFLLRFAERTTTDC